MEISPEHKVRTTNMLAMTHKLLCNKKMVDMVMNQLLSCRPPYTYGHPLNKSGTNSFSKLMELL